MLLAILKAPEPEPPVSTTVTEIRQGTIYPESWANFLC